MPVNRTSCTIAGANNENRVCAVTNPVQLRVKQFQYPGQINAPILRIGVIPVDQDCKQRQRGGHEQRREPKALARLLIFDSWRYKSLCRCQVRVLLSCLSNRINLA
jgi:hypothetical protein